MFDFIKQIRTTRNEAKQGDLTRYHDLIVKAAEKGALSAKETSELDQLATRLALSVEQIEAHAAAIVEVRTLTPKAADFQVRTQAHKESSRRIAAFDEETKRLEDERRQRRKELDRLRAVAGNAMMEAGRAGERIGELHQRYPRLFGIEQKRTPMHIIRDAGPYKLDGINPAMILRFDTVMDQARAGRGIDPNTIEFITCPGQSDTERAELALAYTEAYRSSDVNRGAVTATGDITIPVLSGDDTDPEQQELDQRAIEQGRKRAGRAVTV